MAGITTGTRLEQLEHLRRRIDHEIAQERRRLVLDEAPRQASTRAAPDRPADIDDPHAALSRLGATEGAVRAWARSRGIAVNNRGRVPGAVLEAYLHAHPAPPT